MYIKNFQVAMQSEHHEQKTYSSNILSFKEYVKNPSVENVEIPSDSTKSKQRELLLQELAAAIMKNLYILYKMGFTDNESTKNAYNQITEQSMPKNANYVYRRYEADFSVTEEESMRFQTEALIQTDDKEVHVDIDLGLQRSFTEKTHISKSVKCLDPLVLSFDGTMPELSEEKFCFDIDCDGQSDQISSLSKHSAFLALDKNENGSIDDGSELFGTQSGDGFMDLKAYDEDGNNWIDEADGIFDKLRIWNKTDDTDELMAIGEAGIGAIYLGSQKSEYSLKSDSNELLGEMKQSGFFLNENGTSGVISQIDFAKEDEQSSLKSVFSDLDENDKNAEISPLHELENRIKQMQNELITSNQSDQNALKEQIIVLNRKLSNLKKLS